MASTSVPGVPYWGNLYSLALPGAHGLSPCYGGGLRAPFLLGCGGAGMADHTRPRVCPSLCFSYPGERDAPVRPSRLLVRPRLLTRV
jgi:hypothetical protein